MKIKSLALLLLVASMAVVTVGCSGNDDPGTPTAAPANTGAGSASTPNAGAKGGIAPPGI